MYLLECFFLEFLVVGFVFADFVDAVVIDFLSKVLGDLNVLAR